MSYNSGGDKVCTSYAYPVIRLLFISILLITCTYSPENLLQDIKVRKCVAFIKLSGK